MIQATLQQVFEKQYRIEQEIGRGGMGVVYKAHDLRLERAVAIKVLNLGGPAAGEAYTEAVSRFQQEARAIARLNHPGIVTVYDVGEAEGDYYMVMEYIDGKPLSALIGGQPIAPQLVASMGLQACQALDMAHEQGIVHRDIKPANLMLNRKGQIKLMDFGIARLNRENGRLTQAGSVMGSLLYASPEQIQDAGAVDLRTDLYSLGVTLYELLTGRLPYAQEQVSALLLEILAQQPLPDVRTHNPQVPEGLAQIVARSLTKDRQGRYPSAQAMADDLAALLGPSRYQSLRTTEVLRPDTGGSGQPARRTTINRARVTDLEQDLRWMRDITQDWVPETLPDLPLPRLIARLSDPPLIGKGLSGLLLIEGRYGAWLCEGTFTGAVDFETGASGLAVWQMLPDSGLAELRRAPASQERLPLILSNLAEGTGLEVHKQLDTSLVEMRSLIASFSDPEDPLTGYVIGLTANNVVYYAYAQGQQIMAAAADSHDPALNRDSLSDLNRHIQQTGMVLSVYRCQAQLAPPAIRHHLQQAQVQLKYRDPEQSTLQKLVDMGTAELPLHLIKEAKQNLQLELTLPHSHVDIAGQTLPLIPTLMGSRYLQLLQWFYQEYFYQLNASGNTQSLKYIYDWMAATQRIQPFATLIGEDKRERSFTLVAHGEIPGEGYDKVLHLFRFGSGTAAELERFLDDCLSVKKALIKSGDIGGAVYISAGEMATEALKLFYARTVEPRKGFGLGSLDKLTRYKGFVRMGLNRGFHLNLIEYPVQGRPEVVAPLLK